MLNEYDDQLITAKVAAIAKMLPGTDDNGDQTIPPISDATLQHPPSLAFENAILERFYEALIGAKVVGEEKAAKLIFLAVTSRLLDEPVSLVIKGPSSGGKSYIVEQVLKFFPPCAFYALTAMSEHALAYSQEPLVHRMLVLYEAAGLNSDMATYMMRSLLSEGRVRYETVEKVKGGGMKPRLIEREGPTGLIITTTAFELHPENETRLISVNVTDTPAQTKAVLRAIASEVTQEPDYYVWHALQLWLKTQKNAATIPYADILADLVPPDAVRLRRDFKALLSLIRAHAILHQAGRARDGEERIIATLEDYGVVRDLVMGPMSEGVGKSVSATVRETVQAVNELSSMLPLGQAGISLTQLVKKMGLDKSTIYRRVKGAIKKGYLNNLEEKKSKPARLEMGDAMPGEEGIFPTVAVLQSKWRGIQDEESPF